MLYNICCRRLYTAPLNAPYHLATLCFGTCAFPVLLHWLWVSVYRYRIYMCPTMQLRIHIEAFSLSLSPLPSHVRAS